MPSRLAPGLPLLVVTLACGCGPAARTAQDAAAGGGRWPAGRPSVVLVSIDTLRADYVSAAPFLSRLAAQGRSFSTVYSSSNWTLPSHVSLLTSRPYIEHDVPPAGSAGAAAAVRLSPAQPTLASVLQDAGYATAATTEGGWVRPAFGFDQGFERFSVSEPVSAGGTGVFDEHLALARDFLAGRGDRPFFLFVHTYWVHDYFVNSPEYHTLTTEADAPYVGLGNLLENVRPAQRKSIPAGFGKRLYLAGVRRADRFVEDLVDAVVAASGGAPILVVVTSDHGESLGERPGVWGHGLSLDEVQIRVPLIAWSNADPRLRGDVDVAVSAIDVAPSVLRWLGLEVPSLFRGASDRFTAPRPAPTLVLSRHHSGRRRRPAGVRTVQALIFGGWKYVEADDLDGRRLSQRCFELARDPAGLDDRMAERPPQCVRLRDTYARLRAVHRSRASGQPAQLPPLDPAVVEQLRALGYVD